jgi:hypothetical protein
VQEILLPDHPRRQGRLPDGARVVDQPHTPAGGGVPPQQGVGCGGGVPEVDRLPQAGAQIDLPADGLGAAHRHRPGGPAGNATGEPRRQQVLQEIHQVVVPGGVERLAGQGEGRVPGPRGAAHAVPEEAVEGCELPGVGARRVRSGGRRPEEPDGGRALQAESSGSPRPPRIPGRRSPAPRPRPVLQLQKAGEFVIVNDCHRYRTVDGNGPGRWRRDGFMAAEEKRQRERHLATEAACAQGRVHGDR